MGRKSNNLVIGLDIGTTKVCAVVGEANGKEVDVIGIGTHTSKGMRKGMVVNIESTIHSIQKAIDEAELMAGCDISSVFSGIAGCHIRSINSHGAVPIKNGEVRDGDVKRVINAAQAVKIPENREIIHVLPQEFMVDTHGSISEPVGITGRRLEVKVHIVTGDVSLAENIVKCANRNGLNVNDLILQPLASAEAVLHEDEKELGVCLVDIGGGTTDITIYANGSVRHTKIIGIGGNHVTNDISVGLRTPVEEAGKIKIRHGCAQVTKVQREDTIEVPAVGGRKPRSLSRQLLAEIIEPRMEEIFEFVQKEIKLSGSENMLGSGIVLTGGASLLPGVQDLVELMTGLPVRIGIPKGIGGLIDVVSNPGYATAVGLMMMGYKKHYKDKQEKNGKTFVRFKDWMGSWMNSFF